MCCAATHAGIDIGRGVFMSAGAMPTTTTLDGESNQHNLEMPERIYLIPCARPYRLSCHWRSC